MNDIENKIVCNGINLVYYDNNIVYNIVYNIVLSHCYNVEFCFVIVTMWKMVLAVLSSVFIVIVVTILFVVWFSDVLLERPDFWVPLCIISECQDEDCQVEQPLTHLSHCHHQYHLVLPVLFHPCDCWEQNGSTRFSLVLADNSDYSTQNMLSFCWAKSIQFQCLRYLQNAMAYFAAVILQYKKPLHH